MRFRCERLDRRSAFTATNATGRGAVFTCPSAKVADAGRQLNYSANPNVCKDERFSALVRATAVPRPTETVLAADGIQYRPNGDAQAIFWGMLNAAGAYVSFNDGLPANRYLPILVGPDRDAPLADTDPAGANLRYRHSGRVTEGQVYTDY